MKIPEPYFAEVPDIGDLMMEYIILEYDYPILFVCRAKKNDGLYLCDCCDTYKEQRWLIAPVSEQTLLDLLYNRITIRKAFETATAMCCVATWSKGFLKENYRMISAEEFEPDDLPLEGECLDVEGEEFNGFLEYILGIRNGTVNKCAEEKSQWDSQMKLSSFNFFYG